MSRNRTLTESNFRSGKTTRRTLLRGAAGTAAGGALLSSGAAAWPHVIRAQEPVTISLWWANSEASADWQSSLEFLEAFHQSHPNIRVEPQSVSLEQILNRITIAAQGGELPDVCWALPEDIPTYYQMGLLADYSEKWAEWEEREGVAEAAVEGLTFDGKILSGMPETLNARSFQYHASLFEEAGVTNVPETWDDLVTAGQALTESGVPGFGFCGASVRLPQELIVFLWQNDLDIAVDTGDGVFRNTWADDPAETDRATEVFQFYHDLMYTHGIVPQEATAWGYQELDTRFAQATVASCQNGPWMSNYIESNPDTMADVELAAIPYKLTPATFLEVGYAVTFDSSPHPDEAWEFLKFVGSKEAQSLPLFRDQTVRSDVEVETQWAQSLQELAPQGKTWPPIALGQIQQHMIDSVQRVLLEQASPEEAALTLAEQTNAALVEQGQG
jgi:ABC-type glycerol-3-phosphate transport system substrate-binding protein